MTHVSRIADPTSTPSTGLSGLPLALCFLGLGLLTGLVSGCGTSDDGAASPDTSSLSASTTVEYFDPETKRLKKSEGRTLYGTYIGKRTWWHQNQQVAKEGQYDEQGKGLKVGEWKEYHRNTGAEAARYSYREDSLDGRMTRWHPNGTKSEEGSYNAGLKDGLWTTWHLNGKEESKTTFKDGKEDGPFTAWHDDGAVKERGTFVNGSREGLHEVFAPNGTVVVRGEYRAGLAMAPIEGWYENGSRMSYQPIEGGERHGEEITWWPSEGETSPKRRSRLWERGRQVGPELHWHQDGSRAIITQYVDGRRHGIHREWHSTGALASLITVESGEKSGIGRNWYTNGQLAVMGNYVADQGFGIYQAWHENGVRKQVGELSADARVGAWFIWTNEGELLQDHPEASGWFENGKKVRSLNEEELARAEELQKDTAPLAVPSETVDPLTLFDENGDAL